MSFSQYVVFVRHDKSLSLDFILRHVMRGKIVEVWTSGGVSNEVANRCFEFSGYQFGLDRVLSLLKDAPSDSIHSVTFVNDTLVKAHFRLFVLFLFNLVGRKTAKRKKVSGLGVDGGGHVYSMAGSGSYLSSWFFRIDGTFSDLESIGIVSPIDSLERFKLEIYESLPCGYKAEVDLWLKPKCIWKGWYQAIPGVSVELETIWRKRFAIYLEHTLPCRLGVAGFSVEDFSVDLGFVDRTLYNSLKFADRLFVNYKKLGRRFYFVLSKSFKGFFYE